MTISFANIPSTQRAPGVFVEIDGSKAQQGLAVKPYRGLLVGSKIAAGSQAHLAPARVTSLEQIGTLFGVGSLLYEMGTAWFASNKFTELWCVSVDDTAGTAAVNTITVTVSTAVAGTVYLYIAGHRVPVAVAAAAAQNTIAASINTAINADTTLPVTSSVLTNVVTVTARNKGVVTGDLDLRVNFYSGEATPGGVTIVIANTVAGATDPTLGASLWSAIGEEQFDVMVFGWNGTANLTVVNTELALRWGALRANDGVAFFGYRGTFSAAAAAGAAQNSQFLSILAMNASPTWTPAIAASMGAVAAFYLNQDPARPLNTLPLDYILAPAAASRFTLTERDQLLKSGIATFVADTSGVVRVDRCITTYQKNSASTPDTAFLDITTQFTLSYMRWSFANVWKLKYSRHKLAASGTNFGAGQPVMTPAIGKAEAISIFRLWEDLGLSEDIDGFKRDLIVERSAVDPTRLDMLLPVNVVNGLHVTAVKLEFRL